MALSVGRKKIFRCQACFRHFLKHSSKLKSDSVRVRFAPSPTGQLHLGSLRTALYNYLFSKSHGGTFILRIEDTDQTRLVPGAEEEISEVLNWTGINPDEGPMEGGEYGPYRQSERTELYHKYIEILLQNKTAYRCFCTPLRLSIMRKDCLRRGENPRYDGRCCNLSEEEIKAKLEEKEPYVVRFKMGTLEETIDDIVFGPTKFNIADVEGDPILLKSDGYPTYHFANVVDDHLMNITHVLRGLEWHVSTPKHVLLFKAFGWEPPKYAHLPLILTKGGKKLSKRQKDINVQYYRDHGYEAEAVVNYITMAGGGFRYGDEIKCRSLQELVNRFSIDDLVRNAGQLQIDKLEKLNSSYLKTAINTNKRQELIEKTRNTVSNFLKENDSPLKDKSDNEKEAVDTQDEVSTNKDVKFHDDYIFQILKWAVDEDRISNIHELVGKQFQYLWSLPDKLDIEILNSLQINISLTLRECLSHLEGLDSVSYNRKDLNDFFTNFAKEKQINFPEMMTLLRYVVTGKKQGPGVAEMMDIIGKRNILPRLETALSFYEKSVEK